VPAPKTAESLPVLPTATLDIERVVAIVGLAFITVRLKEIGEDDGEWEVSPP
jgi:hypothetical protein